MRFGICVSTGSACNAKEASPSHVLAAMGVPREYINGSLRATIGEHNTKEDVDFLLDNIEKIVIELRSE